MDRILLILAAGIMVLLVARACNQGYDDPVEPYRTSLETLAEFQTEYRLEHGSYSSAPQLEGWEAAERYVAMSGRAEKGGWFAISRRRHVMDWGCVYVTSGYSEAVTTPGGKPADPFSVVCDDGPPPGSPLERRSDEEPPS